MTNDYCPDRSTDPKALRSCRIDDVVDAIVSYAASKEGAGYAGDVKVIVDTTGAPTQVRLLAETGVVYVPWHRVYVFTPRAVDAASIL